MDAALRSKLDSGERSETLLCEAFREVLTSLFLRLVVVVPWATAPKRRETCDCAADCQEPP